MVGTDWDVTELVKANETSWRALQIAQDSNRTKSDFLANMSHEIRTPMNAILGITYLARRADPSPKQLDYLTKIGNAAESLLGIMNDILDFSKIEAGKLELEVISFSLNDVLRNLLDVVGTEGAGQGRGPGDLSITKMLQRSWLGIRCGWGRFSSTWSTMQSSSPTSARSRFEWKRTKSAAMICV